MDKDFCADLLVDSSDALRWLENMNSSLAAEVKKSTKCFTFDFKALYDSLNPELVKEAMMYAMDTCRPEWTMELKNWLLSLIDFSLRAAVAKYGNAWYKQKNGVPTGGSLCVQLANITVFYVMYKKVYSQPHMMQNVREIRRFIDDGTGLYSGTEEQFRYWLRVVNANIGLLGLNIDESNFKPPHEFVNFLDIQFCFDQDGELQTDLYTKETDSRSYLNFSSAHPNHTFSGNVYAQSLRLRRIINNKERLQSRLDELSIAFKNAGYPEDMIKNITTKVLNLPRNIAVKEKSENDDERIRVISTFKADDATVKAILGCEESFKQTPSFRTMGGKLFAFVKKVAPNIRSQVNALKHQALGTVKGGLKKCHGRGCKCCKMINLSPFQTVNNRKIRLASGTCKTFNIIYLAVCQICNKPYTGRTVDPLHKRINGHRHLYKEVLKKSETGSLDNLDTTNDMFTLGLHLYQEHGCRNPLDFDVHLKFAILEVVNPSDIEVKELKWMHQLNTFQPIGINIEYPFGLPFLELR